MLEYEFETVQGGGFGSLVIDGHREIIRKRGERGWRFAGWIPSRQKGYGYIAQIDLIFERETEGRP